MYAPSTTISLLPNAEFQEAQFTFEGFAFQMIDVGGQRYAVARSGDLLLDLVAEIADARF